MECPFVFSSSAEISAFCPREQCPLHVFSLEVVSPERTPAGTSITWRFSGNSTKVTVFPKNTWTTLLCLLSLSLLRLSLSTMSRFVLFFFLSFFHNYYYYYYYYYYCEPQQVHSCNHAADKKLSSNHMAAAELSESSRSKIAHESEVNPSPASAPSPGYHRIPPHCQVFNPSATGGTVYVR